jgi:hypothetical protein
MCQFFSTIEAVLRALSNIEHSFMT